MTVAKIPHAQSTAYRAAAHLHKNGPLTRAELFTQVEFPGRSSNRTQSLDAAIANGWLIETLTRLACGPDLVKHFDSLEAPASPEYIGQIATPREPLTPLYDRPPLSSKYLTNSRGTHARDIDSRFQRSADHHFFSVPAVTV